MSEEKKDFVGVPEELRTAAEMGGPRSTDPPNERLPFPLIALPLVLRRFVQEASEAMGVDPECVATPVLATCATAIGNTCRIRLNGTWTEPSVLWAITLMDSGSLKTPAYNAAVEPLRAAQQLYEEQLETQRGEYRRAKAIYDADSGLWNAQSQPDPGQPPAEPVEPKPVDLFTSDSTVEALGLLFANNPRGLALTRDELSGFFQSFGAYKGGRGGDEAAYLEFHNAGTIKLNRAGGKRIYVHRAALSIFGTCQPSVFERAIGADGRGSDQVENGLAARFIIAAPVPRAKRWRKNKPYEPRHYWKLVNELLAIPLPRDAEGRPEPAVVELLPEAEATYATFVDEHGDQTLAIANPGLRYHYAKLEAVAARLALIFYLCDGATGQLAGPPGVQERHILSGIALARWYGREAQRFYEGYASATEHEKRKLLKTIHDRGGTITPREMRGTGRRWSDPQAAEMALRTLARAGYGEMVVESAGPRGGRPSLRFKILPKPVETPTPETPTFVEIPAAEEGLAEQPQQLTEQPEQPSPPEQIPEGEHTCGYPGFDTLVDRCPGCFPSSAAGVTAAANVG